MRTAIVPGSFDPMTLGHRDIVVRALSVFDRVIIAIFGNPEKNGTFSFEQRAEIARITLRDLERIEIVTGEGFLADYAASVGACAIVKGIRNAEDLRYENSMAFFNLERNPNTQTLYLPARPEFRRVSSTLARRRLEEGGSLRKLMDSEAYEYAKRVVDSKNGT